MSDQQSSPPRGPPPYYNYQINQGNQAQSASHGKPKTQIASKNSAQSGPKKRKVAENAFVSQPKAVQQQLPVVLLSLANKILQHRLCNCRLLRGWSLLLNLIGRLNFTKLLWNAFGEAWFIITGPSLKTSKKLTW